MSTMLLPPVTWLKKGKSSNKEEKEKGEMVSMSYLNDDLVFNIFSRIPGDILQKKFKYQCRMWFNLISNPIFVETHLHQAEDGILLRVKTLHQAEDGILPRVKTETDLKKGKDKLLFMNLKGLETNKVKEIILFPRKFLVRCVCNGLICFQVSGNEELIYVTNPTTNQTVLLPTRSNKEGKCFKTRNCRWDLVFVPQTKTYKLLELLYDCNLKSYVFHIHTSSGESWGSPIKELGQSAFTYYERISVNGILYMHINNGEPIISFDAGDEKTIRLFPLPENYFRFQWLIKMDGFLTLIGTNKCPYVDYNVWILKDGEWVKRLSFCVPQEINRYPLNESKVLGSLNNGEVIIFEDGNIGRRILIFYVKNKLWKAVDIFKPDKLEISKFFPATHVNNSMVSF